MLDRGSRQGRRLPERGQGLAEYAVALGIIALVALVALALFNPQVTEVLSTTSGSV